MVGDAVSEALKSMEESELMRAVCTSFFSMIGSKDCSLVFQSDRFLGLHQPCHRKLRLVLSRYVILRRTKP